MAGGPVGIIAGRGHLPVHLGRAVCQRGGVVVLAAMDGTDPENPDGWPQIDFLPERLGQLFDALGAAGVREVVFAGGLQRPALKIARLDLRTLRLLPRIVAGLRGGDDATLRLVASLFEGAGFTVRAAHDLAPDLLLPPGCPTRAQPTAQDRRDVERAAAIVATLGQADVGQGAVVAGGLALAVEAIPGTDRMLDWVADVAGDWRRKDARGVLYKAPKPDQDRRMDLPAIGPETMRRAAKAGLAGIALEGGGVMALQAPEIIEIADREGLFLWSREPDP